MPGLLLIHVGWAKGAVQGSEERLSERHYCPTER